MKNKIILLALAFTFMSAAVSAQGTSSVEKTNESGDAFSKGSVSLMIASGFGVSYNYYGDYVSLPALTVAVDIGIFDNAGPGNIGVGGIVGFKRAFNRRDGYDATWTNFLIAGRGTYHLTLVDNSKFDPYAGVTAGIRINEYRDPSFNDLPNPNNYNSIYPVAGVFVGAKYNFIPGFGGFVELGYDISIVRVGVSFNF